MIGTVKLFTVEAINNKIDFVMKHIAKMDITNHVYERLELKTTPVNLSSAFIEVHTVINSFFCTSL
jgi:hypothetical protein